MVRLFKKRFKGVAILEAAMTLPIILSILFFALEFIRIELAQIAADAIARRCTMELMNSMDSEKEGVKENRMKNFDKIIDELRPLGIPLKNIRFYIRLYPNISDMMNVSPYGGETIGWAGSDYDNPEDLSPNDAAKRNFYGLSPEHPLMRGYYNTQICDGVGGEVGDETRVDYLTNRLDTFNIKGYAFVFTVAIKFPFSSAYVAKFFGNGSNTNKEGVYLIWARGSGIVNVYNE